MKKITLKNVFCIILLLSNAMLPAQNKLCNAKKEYSEFTNNYSIEISSLESDDFSDLQFLKDVLKDKRIVFYGEYLHAIQEIDLFKVRLFKFLHQELGFEVVLFESGMYECLLTNENLQSISAQEALDNSLFPIFRNEGQYKLLQYVKENELQMGGIDVSNTAYTKPEYFSAFVADTVSKFYREIYNLEKDYNAFFNDYRMQYVKNGKFDDYDQMNNRRFALIKRFEEAAKLLKKNKDAWKTSIGNMQRKSIQRAINNQEFLLSNLICFKNKSESNKYKALFEFNKRDSCMYANLRFLKDSVYADKKILLFAHNGHCSYRENVRYKSFGSYLSEKEKEEIFNIGVYACENKFETRTTKKPKKNFLEAILGCSPYNYSFLHIHNNLDKRGSQWLIDGAFSNLRGVRTIENKLHKQYDGLFFVKEATRAKKPKK